MENEKVTKNILELSNSDARDFLLKGKSYCSFDLPKYFIFDPVILELSKELESKNLKDYYLSIPKLNDSGVVITDDHGNEKICLDSPRNYEDVNYKLLNNKDGKYAWRPLQIIHPALYVSLVHKITDEENWKTILECFINFANNKNIICMSLPVRSENDESDKAAMVSQWWHKVEQESIELALDYQYLLETDITDCYGSIYTHSIAWALHSKAEAKKKNNRNNKTLIGNVIDSHLQDMSFGQTNGIPQGSVLMDFIAEIVLGYADLELSEKIGDSIKDYKIIRYRDDYRIFVNNPEDGESIIKSISEVLIDLGMKLNPQKTTSSNDVIKDSLKEDKRYWIDHKKSGKSLQKHLLVIHSLSQKYPNSGSLVNALNDYFSRIKNTTKTRENVTVLISIITDILLKNPRTYSISTAILSKFIILINENSEKLIIIRKIINRFEKIPNSGYAKLWLQRITLKLDDQINYHEKLCDIVYGKDIPIWNSEWLKDTFKEKINPAKIICSEIKNESTPEIEIEEVQLFKGYM